MVLVVPMVVVVVPHAEDRDEDEVVAPAALNPHPHCLGHPLDPLNKLHHEGRLEPQTRRIYNGFQKHQTPSLWVHGLSAISTSMLKPIVVSFREPSPHKKSKSRKKNPNANVNFKEVLLPNGVLPLAFKPCEPMRRRKKEKKLTKDFHPFMCSSTSRSCNPKKNTCPIWSSPRGTIVSQNPLRFQLYYQNLKWCHQSLEGPMEWVSLKWQQLRL